MSERERGREKEGECRRDIVKKGVKRDKKRVKKKKTFFLSQYTADRLWQKNVA